jgi:dTDP-4-dehydrorhamnose 3,5-epimerase-like enzyme|tara:strand:+ start:903 stop:1307 length:405 start_codon:yes stop_codon:yes gene_type:complete
MSKPKILKTNFKDRRGKIIDVFQNIKFEHSTIITFNKNAVRANHFHKKSIQYSLIIDGKFIAREAKINKKMKYNINKVKSYKISANYLFAHKPYEAHAYKCLSSKGTMIVFTKGIRGGKNYEDDTYRLERKLIE